MVLEGTRIVGSQLCDGIVYEGWWKEVSVSSGLRRRDGLFCERLACVVVIVR